MKICVMGQGYIGLPTAAMFAHHGCDVVGVDVSPPIVDTLNSGQIHIEEPGLAEIVGEVVKNGRYHASLQPEKADAFIIAVPTPNRDDAARSCDLGHVVSACQAILPVLEKGNVVIIESTIAPKSTDDVIRPIFEGAGFTIGEDLYLAHCPERVLPGQILHELTHNNRIVGGITPACSARAASVYEVFVQGALLITEARTAEMAKCMENTFRDVNIALANELAKVCFELDIDCLDVIALANQHPRVNLHSPGPGVGGHCLAVDPYFVSAQAPDTAKLIRLARDTNEAMPSFIVERAQMLLLGIEKPIVAAFGTAYKGNVDDTRESPALVIIEALKAAGIEVRVHDAHVNGQGYVDFEQAAAGADLVLVLTDHNEYKQMPLDELAQLMRRPMVLDTKHIVPEGENVPVVHLGNLWQYK